MPFSHVDQHDVVLGPEIVLFCGRELMPFLELMDQSISEGVVLYRTVTLHRPKYDLTS